MEGIKTTCFTYILIMAISSITTGPRQSNFELLRLVAMFLVLVVHADFSSLGEPSLRDFQSDIVGSTLRVFIESLSIVCVNVFILISGWFGIRQSLKSFCNFLFQCFFFLGGTYTCLVVLNRTPLNLSGLLTCFGLNNWFIMSYLGLFILAPIINPFLDTCGKKKLGLTILSFYVFQTLCGWPGFAKYFELGYSTLSFVGLYLIGRYLRICNGLRNFISPLLFHWICFGICSISLTGIYIIQVYSGIKLGVFSFINPLVVVSSVFLFLGFAHLKLKHNRYINFMAKSAFAVFLLHTQSYIFDRIYKVTLRELFSEYSGLSFLLFATFFLLCIFTCAILLDQPRKWLWKAILSLKE